MILATTTPVAKGNWELQLLFLLATTAPVAKGNPGVATTVAISDRRDKILYSPLRLRNFTQQFVGFQFLFLFKNVIDKNNDDNNDEQEATKLSFGSYPVSGTLTFFDPTIVSLFFDLTAVSLFLVLRLWDLCTDDISDGIRLYSYEAKTALELTRYIYTYENII